MFKTNIPAFLQKRDATFQEKDDCYLYNPTYSEEIEHQGEQLLITIGYIEIPEDDAERFFLYIFDEEAKGTFIKGRIEDISNGKDTIGFHSSNVKEIKEVLQEVFNYEIETKVFREFQDHLLQLLGATL